MIFLNPAILFGLAAATIPVIIHLLNLRKLKKIEFSTLKFLKELQKNKIRRVKLKQWLLLALRVMIIIMIVTAFARPTIEGVTIGGTTSAAKTTAIFILDDTFSMSVVDENGSYFNQAKKTIKQLLTQLEDGDEAAIILISGDHKEELPLKTNIGSLADLLNNLKISSASGTINSALIKASDLISGSKNFNKEIYLLTDFQKGRIAKKENIIDLNTILNKQVKIYSFGYSKKGVYNVAVDDLKVRTKIFEKDKPIEFETTITNYSDQNVNNLVVSLFVGGQRSAQQSINLNPGESKTVQLEGITEKTGFINIIVEIEDDEVVQDNKRYTALYIPQTISILMLYDNIKDTKFVKLALQSSVVDGNFNITEFSLSRLNSLQLGSYDVIILIGSEIKFGMDNLKDYMINGGGLVMFPSSIPDLQSFQETFNYLNLPQPGSIVVGTDDAGSLVDFEKVDFYHPVFQNIFRDEKKKEIESPAIKNYYKILPAGKGKSIITLIDGSSFLSEYSVGKGKLFVINVSPVLEWSDFPLKSIFTPFIYKSVIYLSTKVNNESEYIAGNTLNINISQRTLPQIKIEKPDRTEDLINLNDDDSDFLSYKETFISGNYKILSGNKLLGIISVNTDPLESNVNYVPDEEFDEYLDKINFSGSHIRIEKGQDPVSLILQARFGSELWRYFLIAAFILALAEMTIARSAKKELVDVEG
ncbi:MAG: BatA and WFA domain-containing protein [Bacteroidetes bacterium]|nr:BatA and WFA domain-containing protein [Bacteroidota bacterium]